MRLASCGALNSIKTNMSSESSTKLPRTITCSIPLISVDSPKIEQPRRKNNNNVDSKHLSSVDSVSNSSSSGDDGRSPRAKKKNTQKEANKSVKKATTIPALVSGTGAMETEKQLLTQFSVTSSDNAGLRMKIAIPRSEPSAGLPPSSTTTKSVVARRRGRPTKKAHVHRSSSGSDCSSSSSSDSESEQEKSAKRRSKGSASSSRQQSRKSSSLKRSSSTSSSDFESFSGNGKRNSGRPKIRPTAASTPASTSKASPAQSTIDTTPIKRRPGRPPKKAPNAPITNALIATTSQQPSRVKEARLSLVDGASSTDNDASMAINAAINRVFESGGSDSELNVAPSLPATSRVGPSARQRGRPTTVASSSSSTTLGGVKLVLTPIQYTSSLLRDFVEKTQKLGQQQEVNVTVPDQFQANSLPRESSATEIKDALGESKASTGAVVVPAEGDVVVRRKRGRPPKKPQLPPEPVKMGQAVAHVKTDRLNSRLKVTMRDSPDSGILSVNQSPSHSPRLVKKAAGASISSNRSQATPQRSQPQQQPGPPPTSLTGNTMLLSLEKPMYTTERVLYPPRNIKRGRPPLNKQKEVKATGQNEVKGGRAGKAGGVDPIWRKIDINKKFQRPTNGYKSDGGGAASGVDRSGSDAFGGGFRGEGSSVVCSKVLAAQCGYASDYSSVRKSRQSGYRSDYSTKSRKSGYRSDYSMKGGGCGYRSDCSVRKKLRRKRRTKSVAGGTDRVGNMATLLAGGMPTPQGTDSYHSMRNMATGFDEQDILQLAGLSLGNSSDDDSGNEVTVLTKGITADGPTKRGNIREWIGALRRPVVKFASTCNQFAHFNRSKFERDFIMNYRALVAANRLEAERINAKINPPEEAKAKLKKGDARKPEMPKYNCFESFSNVLPIIELKSKRTAKSIRSRRSSAVSRCSSRSNRSMHHKHRRKRLKSKSESGPVNKLAEKLKMQLEQIIEMFAPACKLVDEPTATKLTKTQVQSPQTPATTTSAVVVAPVKEKEIGTPKTIQKRGMKKRKFSENTEQCGTPSGTKRRTKKGQESQSPDDHKLPLKKRHYLLADGEKGTGELVKDGEKHETASDGKTPSTPKGKPPAGGVADGETKTQPSTPNHSPAVSVPTPRGRKTQDQQQQQQEQKKKLLSPTGSAGRGRPPKSAPIDKKMSPVPPPGVFEPTMDLELQIPMSTIMISGAGKAGSLLTVRSKGDKCMDSPSSSSSKKKRKKINRTGFPTVKKKKKRPTLSNLVTVLTQAEMPDLKLEKCDRVPSDGEATSKFIERNDAKTGLPILSLERLENPELLANRVSRPKEIGTETAKRSRETSKDQTLTPTVTATLPRAAKKVKLEEVLVAPEIAKKLPGRRGKVKTESPVIPAPQKSRGRRATSTERSSETTVRPERRISLLEEISPHKRQSIRNLAKTLMVSEHAPKTERPETVEDVAKKIEPRKRRMTMAVVEAPKVSETVKVPAPPIKEESPTAAKDIKPATCAIELEHDPLPPDDDEGEVVLRTDTPSSELSDRSNTKKVPKWKRKYLPAGLFSDYYKEGDRDRSVKSTVGQQKDEVVVGPALLPPPPYCERFFRRTETEFQLPHDLWWAHDNQKLPGRDTVASWNFRKIRTNVYSDVKPSPNTDLPSCNCRPSSGCVDDCLNRMVYTECCTDTCPCEDKCQNTKIQRHEFASGIERFMTEKKGWGVRTKKAIRKSQFILEYLGEVVTEREFKERMGTLYAKDMHHYCLHLDGDLVIDGHRMGSDCRFVNHSCTPNCEVQKWNVNGLSRMCLFALRDIKPGEELTYDYNFALYNPSEGQPCKCDSADCRGVIGGKSQRVAKPAVVAEDGKGGTAARNRKRQAKKNHSQPSAKVRPTTPLFQIPTCKEMAIIRESHCFLMRNLMKVRKQKDVLPLMQEGSGEGGSRRTRTLKEETDESVIQLRTVLMRICSEMMMVKKEGADDLWMNMLLVPPKKKNPKYHERIERPIDLNVIHGNADKWVYRTVKSFDEDMRRMFRNVQEYYASGSEEQTAAEALRKVYESKKEAEYESLLQIVGGDRALVKEFEPVEINELELKLEPNEDIIRCICGLFKDEGLMIECSKCQVWQHAECTRADTEVDYQCERCEPRQVNLEITLDEYSDEGYQYYLSLLRGTLQIRQTDTVYVLRDIPMTPDKNDPEKKVRKHTYETIGRIDYADCDIFRVERLWKDDTGKRFVFGHHYLRPHETYHEPTRKFYANEVVRVPLYEVVPIELIIDRCWVLDPTTYCKGRPVDSIEEHVYICELRVDKGARIFAKVPKQSNPVCTKSYAFKKFKQKLKICKTYAPHDHAPIAAMSSKPTVKKRKQDAPIASRKNSTSIVQLRPPPPKTLQEKRQRLESTLTRLMVQQRASNPGSSEMDLSYLLTGRGARTKSSRATLTAVTSTT